MPLRTLLAALCAAAICQAPAWAREAPGVAREDINPEIAGARSERAQAHARRYMIATANPLASEAGYRILRAGGSATDAIIAAQLVLNLVEPQSSGIGGGAFMVHYDRGAGELRVYDSRETAPAAARPDRFLREGKPLSYAESVNNGRAVGTPGLLRGLELAHRQHGKLPWQALFEPAIAMAEQGFPVSPRLHASIAGDKALAAQPAAARYFYGPDGQAWPVGHRLKNPEFAATLRSIAREGADAFYRGPIARDIVAAVRAHPTPGDLSEADLAGYRAVVREPVCGLYRGYRLCGAPPPSSGPLAVLQMLGELEQYPLARMRPGSVEAVHYFSEAGRLAFADRDFYVADPAFVDVPVRALLDPAYLRQRGALIRPDRSMKTALPGDPQGLLAERARDDAIEVPSTSHLVAVDAAGNVVSMTSTIEAAFGSKIFVRGFLLNNEMTDFSSSYRDPEGRLVANRVEPGKRPRSSMAPMIVFRAGKPVLALGSPGGSAIINYVAKTLVGVLDWKLDVQQAIALPNLGSRNKETELERGTALEALAPALRRMGHEVRITDFPSGIQGIVIGPHGLAGGADPRREGLALGD
ncbi:gamma-glutamyltransferase [Bordetella bronchiseptica]|uniref:gamma-glutamyltransferase n=1 Tax=Bordetella bronchiseptica TaxID=518 RepID=UPI000461F893|nr:gamma-glutamyltransferase [Bordetella bronchiseptica]AWP86222.1 gamma-glutamyltransferase [Bordetella bronchiseptica]AWQ11795.1 gamma-glutamyltransferase [Bordetella bronchiseptica]AXT87859.1 gamma-glutamyltransferase [Bordetella bronchiseptica]KDB79635.1 gamma-glutamyltransferase [Bordetella bronchiseptica CARE970018BB]KDC93788.1 gamma-glutamyltransferase [Bordetella bronchiseptica MBORD670]